MERIFRKGQNIVSEVKFEQQPSYEVEEGKTLATTAKIAPTSLVNKMEYSHTSATESVQGNSISVVVTNRSPGIKKI